MNEPESLRASGAFSDVAAGGVVRVVSLNSRQARNVAPAGQANSWVALDSGPAFTAPICAPPTNLSGEGRRPPHSGQTLSPQASPAAGHIASRSPTAPRRNSGRSWCDSRAQALCRTQPADPRYVFLSRRRVPVLSSCCLRRLCVRTSSSVTPRSKSTRWSQSRKLDVSRMTRGAKGTSAQPGRNVARKAGLNREIPDTAPALMVQLLRYKVTVGCGQLHQRRNCGRVRRAQVTATSGRKLWLSACMSATAAGIRNRAIERLPGWCSEQRPHHA